VPSAVNPIDKNILLNPDHPEMEYVSIEPPERFDFDARMFT
jgi:RES domain-containing protein